VLLAASVSASPAATAHVQYVSATNVYLDAGQSAGLAEGTRVRVERQGKLVAELVVEFVAQNSAACKLQSASAPVQAGDACEFTPVAGAGGGAPSGGSESGTRAPKPPPTRGASLAAGGESVWSNLGSPRGQLSSWYVQSSDPSGTYRNPSVRADLRWHGRDREGLGLRVRASRPELRATSTTATPGSFPVGVGAFQGGAAELRVYELQAFYRSAGEGLELDAGRMIASRLELAGYLDGADVHWRPARGLVLGLAGGRDADLGVQGSRGGGRKLGGFVEASGRSSLGSRSWSAVLAAADLEDPEITRRQFVQLRSDAGLSRRLHLFENLEADVNPPWKRQRGEPRVELTSWSLSSQVQVSRQVSLAVGADSRLPLLLPEQRTLPTNFVRERVRGAHASTHVQLTRSSSLRLGGDASFLPGGRVDRRAWDTSFYSSRLGSAALSGGMHATYYTAGYGRGLLVDGSLSARAAAWARFDASAGTGETRSNPASPLGTAITTRSHWLRAAADLQAPHGLWLDVAGEWRAGQAGDELSLELGRSF
jgi:hypothetical protein